nr:isocitrate lyase/phosphoenolpyruvate mutase family protein [Citrobacter sp. BDA59-3]
MMNFALLHQQDSPLLLANVWDVSSARAAQAEGYKAIGTSSAAIAAMYGYDDGDGITFAELRHLVIRLRACCSLPLTVDMEYGYGESHEQIIENLLALVELGVAGINLEDSRVQQGKRVLQDSTEFASLLNAIRQRLADEQHSLFINARTDTYLLGEVNALAETLARGMLYAQNGADGLFVPCVTQPSDILAIANAIALPLNVMCMPALPPFTELGRLGVKRISMGDFPHQALQNSAKRLFADIVKAHSFDAVFAHAAAR